MMVRQMKEDAKGKSEEELAECFRVFDRCAGGSGLQGVGLTGGGVKGCGALSAPLTSQLTLPAPPPKERRRLHRC